MALQSFRCSFVEPLPCIHRSGRNGLCGISSCTFSCASPAPTPYVHLTFVPWPIYSFWHVPLSAMCIWPQIVFRWYCISSPVSMGSSMSICNNNQFYSSICHSHLSQKIHCVQGVLPFHKLDIHMLGNQWVHANASTFLWQSYSSSTLEIPGCLCSQTHQDAILSVFWHTVSDNLP